MMRFLIGVGVGAALVYYLDQERGAARRAKANTWMRQYVNQDTMEQARQTTVSQARAIREQISQQAGAVNDRVAQYRAERRAATARANADAAVASRELDSATAGANI
ncbi:MAG TPA: hypothetical protein VF808_17270 [Ktedonobacterales bacterium]